MLNVKMNRNNLGLSCAKEPCKRGYWLLVFGTVLKFCMGLVVNWARKWSVFDFLNNSKISQNVLQKSMTEKMIF